MKKAVLSLLLVMTISQAKALIIKGEESKNHFIKVNKIGEEFTFLECKGSYQDFICDGFYPMPITFSEDTIREMASKKRRDMYLAAGADAIMIAIAIPHISYTLAFHGSRYYVSRFMTSYSLDGVGTTSGAIAVHLGTGSLVGTGPSMLGFDALDPFVHRDMALALETIKGDIETTNLEDIELVDDVTLYDSPESSIPYLEKESVVTIEDVHTSQVINSFKKMLKKEIKSRNYEYEDIILGTDGKTPVQKLLEKKMIGL